MGDFFLDVLVFRYTYYVSTGICRTGSCGFAFVCMMHGSSFPMFLYDEFQDGDAKALSLVYDAPMALRPSYQEVVTYVL